jgi:hypothetical protein
MSNEFLSVLCADVTGGERLLERLPASEAAHAVSRFEKRMAQTVEGFRGRLARCAGSRVMAYFSDAEEALQSAVEMQRRVANLPPMSGIALGVRVGVCVGHAANEMRYFECDSPGNAAVSLSQIAAPGQVLMSVPKRAAGFEWNDIVARSHPEIRLSSGKRQLGVYELEWRDFTASQIKSLSANDADAELPFYLHINGQTVELGPERPSLSIGRLVSCGIVVHGEKCSRVHARIVRRGDEYFLVDESTNGTFITPDGGGEHRVLKHELALSGRGRMAFGQPLADAGEEFAHYAIGENIHLRVDSRFA